MAIELFFLSLFLRVFHNVPSIFLLAVASAVSSFSFDPFPPPHKILSVLHLVLDKVNTGVLKTIQFNVILANRSGTKTRRIGNCLICVIKDDPIICPRFCYFTSVGFKGRLLKIFIASIYLILYLTGRF